MQMKFLGITSVDFGVIDHDWSNFLYPADTGEKWEYNGTVHQLFIDFKKAYDSVRRKVLYYILIEFGISRKLVGLIQMCLNEIYSAVCIGKYQSDKFPVQNGFITTAFQLCFGIHH
jgi:hypothetical protein